MFCLSLFLSFLVFPTGGSSSLVAVAGCDGRSDKKELQDMTTALLHAHRCMLKDEPGAVPVPLNTIPDLIVPSHIIVPRCSGLCLNSLGSSCSPKKTKLESHSVVVYVNSTPYCTTIELEHHRGPCRCECPLGPHSCSARQQFLADSCSCQCLPHLARDKLACLNSSAHTWDTEDCQCVCRNTNTCRHGQVFSPDTCSCVENHFNGKLECANQTDSPPQLNLYPLLVIIMAVILFLLLITSLSFTISYKWRRENNLVPRQLEPQTKAYTITLCSNQSLDKAA